MKKSILSVISLALVVLILVSCTQGAQVTTAGDTETNPVTTTSAPVTRAPVTTEEKFEIQKADLGGAKISVIVDSKKENSIYAYMSIFADEDNSSKGFGQFFMLNRAVYERNRNISEKLNCEIYLYKSQAEGASIKELYGSELLAGDPEIDIIAGRGTLDLDLAREGYLEDLSGLSEYISIEKPYWLPEHTSALNPGKGSGIYWLTSDISFSYLLGAQVTIINGYLYKLFCEETFGNLYDLVYEGNWTYDTMLKMLALVDAANESKDENFRIFGMAIREGENINALLLSSGVPFSSVRTDGSIEICISENNENIINAADMLSSFFRSKGVYKTEKEIEDLNYLASDMAMIAFASLFDIQSYLRDMESDCLTLPYPKLSKDQESYYAPMSREIGIYGISKSSADKTNAAMVLEALAIESRNICVPEYKDAYLYYRMCRCDAWKVHKVMMDYIVSCAVIDTAYIWSATDAFGEGEDSLGEFFKSRISLPKEDLLAAIKDKEKDWQSSADKLYDEFIFQNKKDADE